VTFYWFVIWLGLGFGVPEAWALFSHHPERTLSECAWRLLDVVPGNTFWQWTFLHFLVSFLLFWLFLHITFGVLR
jgi:hypothetical protein